MHRYFTRTSQSRVSRWWRLRSRISASQMKTDGVCYTLPMFIHRLFITGCSDRGAWPWRTPQTAPTLAHA